MLNFYGSSQEQGTGEIEFAWCVPDDAWSGRITKEMGMQEYKAVKNIKALQIGAFDGSQMTATSGEVIDLDYQFMGRYSPEIGGYVIIHEDGHMSYLPKDVFEYMHEKVDSE